MKQVLLCLALLLVANFQSSSAAVAVVHPGQSSTQVAVNLEDTFNRKQIESKLGRKLKLKERLALRILKKKAKKASKRTVQDVPKKIGFPLASILCAIVGIFFARVILGAAAMIFGFVGLTRARKYPDTHGGKGLAIIGIIVGAVAMIGAAIVIASMA
ncbi:MAG: DUF4190 domain-containing protein [Bacteroidota bacterium]